MTRAIPWPIIRAQFEAGASLAQLGRLFGVSTRAIQYHKTLENWRTSANPQPMAMAIAPLRRDLMEERHRQEWLTHGRLTMAAIASHDIELAKLAKLTAETLTIRQTGERKAWGFESKEASGSAPTVILSPIVPDEPIPDFPIV